MAAGKSTASGKAVLTLEEYDVLGLELERCIHFPQVAMQRLDDSPGEDLTLMALLLERLHKAEVIVDSASTRR